MNTIEPAHASTMTIIYSLYGYTGWQRMADSLQQKQAAEPLLNIDEVDDQLTLLEENGAG